MAPLPSDELQALIARVAEGDEQAWTSFVERHADVLFQVARSVERDADAAADAFVHACQHLRDRRAARLRAFDPARPGNFETWLRAVALNLCRDARRRRLGRFRPLAALKRLPPLEQRVFRLRHEFGYTFDQTLSALAQEFPGLTDGRLASAEDAVTAQLNSRRRWILLARNRGLRVYPPGTAAPQHHPDHRDSTGARRRSAAPRRLPGAQRQYRCRSGDVGGRR